MVANSPNVTFCSAAARETFASNATSPSDIKRCTNGILIRRMEKPRTPEQVHDLIEDAAASAQVRPRHRHCGGSKGRAF
jgi:hypothetical protein